MKKGVIAVISTLLGAASGATVAGVGVAKAKGKETEQQRERAMKNASVIDALARWVSILQDGKKLSDYFEEKNYKTVAIYGYHYIGERLHRELAENGIKVKYAIDQNRNNVKTEIEVKKYGGRFGRSGCSYCYPYFYFNSIEENWKKFLTVLLYHLKKYWNTWNKKQKI